MDPRPLTDTDKVHRRLGDRIAQARRHAGLTQKELAERIGTSLGQVVKLEEGVVDPVPMLSQIAAAVGQPVESLAVPGLSTDALTEKRSERPADLLASRISKLEDEIRALTAQLADRDRALAELAATLESRSAETADATVEPDADGDASDNGRDMPEELPGQPPAQELPVDIAPAPPGVPPPATRSRMAAELAQVPTGHTAGGRRLALGRFEVGIVAVGVTGAIAGTAAAQGAYFPTSWGWAALSFSFVAAIALVLSQRVELTWFEIAFLGLLAAFAGWIALSIVWSTGVSGTVEEVERVLVYASGSLAFLLVARRGHTVPLLAAILTGLTGICLYGLLGRLFPTELYSDLFAGYRLYSPVGYWNGLGLLAVIAALLAVGFAAEGTRVAARAAAAACLPVLAATAYFTFSRGAWVALAAGLVVMIAISPQRLRLLTTALLLAPGPVIGLWLAWDSPALSHRGATLAATKHEGHRLAVWLLVLTVITAASAVALHVVDRRIRIPRAARQAYAFVLVLAAVGALAFGLVAGGGPVQIARHSYDRFLANPVANENLSRRLFQLSSNGRVELWHVGWREFARNPILGTGAGTFESYWYEHRPTGNQTVRDAHSLYIETLGELGVPGLILLVVMLAVPFAGVRARGRPFVSLALAAYATLLVHASYDWDWELPALMLAGTWCGLAALVESREGRQGVSLGTRGATAVFVAVGAVGAFAFVGLVGNLAAASSSDAISAGDMTKAAREARKAADWAPWAAEPWALLSQAELGQGHQRAAVSALREAIDRQPRDYTLWQQLALTTRGRDRHEALRRLHELNPQEQLP
jgi:transcriptional regulator with XRE-family HTH domain